jgi:hypothetical protein
MSFSLSLNSALLKVIICVEVHAVKNVITKAASIIISFHDYLIAIIGLILNEFLLLVLVALPFVNEEISANTLGVSFPAPSSVELQYQPSKCVPPMIEKEEYTFQDC